MEETKPVHEVIREHRQIQAIRGKASDKRSGQKMKVKRMIEVETNCPEIGDKINIDHYTATCQEITSKGALFLMDQYLGKPYAMNAKGTNRGGYAESDLRETLRSKKILDIFKGIRYYMVPFDNGDLPKNQVKYLPEKCVQNASISGLQARWMNERRNDVCSHGKWRRKMGKI